MMNTASNTVAAASTSRQLMMVVGLAALVAPAAAFSPAGPGSATFATFGNQQTKALIKAWQPKPVPAPSGECFLPSSTENMKRFVRARILLEDASVGAVASHGDSLCLILCRFSRAEHQLLLPLWQTDHVPGKTFEDLIRWHGDRFEKGARLSGARLETAEDKSAWTDIIGGKGI